MSIKEENSFIFQPENFPYIEKVQEWCNKNSNFISYTAGKHFLIFNDKNSLEYLEMVSDVLIPKLAMCLKKENGKEVDELNTFLRVVIRCSAKTYIRGKIRRLNNIISIGGPAGKTPPVELKIVNKAGVEWSTIAERYTQNLFIYLANYYEKRYIEVYTLYYSEGLSQSDIAVQTGLSQPTVSRAIKEMTQFLIDHKEELRYILSDMLDDAGTQ